MGRGKHLSTKQKEMRGLMSAMKEGLADGDIKAAKKKYKGKNLQYIILSKFDKMTSDQIFKFTAMVGIAVVIKSGVDWTEAMIRQYRWLLGIFGIAGLVVAELSKLIEEGDPKTEAIQWLLSFMAAYLIVEHPEAVMGAGQSIVGGAQNLIRLAAGA